MKKWKNPFYALLIPVSLAFVITVFAYGFMAFQQVNASRNTAGVHAEHPLFVWLNEHGTTAVMAELVVLGVLTTGAIATDGWWMGPTNSTTSLRGTPRDEAEEIE